MKKRIVTGWIVLAALLITGLPYLVAYLAAGKEIVFGGFLLNPIDGYSYLAKMYAGWSGSWKFTLPYSADPGQGGYLFLFYIFLGHLARWLQAPLQVVFHAARLLGIIALGIALSRFLERFFEDESDRRRAALLALVGSGLGWLAFMAGQMSADFWVAEAYPILASYANPHFPLALALLLAIFTLEPQSIRQRTSVWLALASLALSTILPFGVVIALVVLGGAALWEWIEQRRIAWVKPIVVLAAGAPMMVYQLLLTYTDPALAGWNAQNLTPSPPLWDLIVATSPALVLAVIGIWHVIENRESDSSGKLLVVWVMAGLILLYVPIGLQRRFMLGFYIPLAALAVIGLRSLLPNWGRRAGWWFTGLLLVSVPTTLIVLLAGMSGVIMRDPMIYLTRDEAQAMSWIRSTTAPNALVAAGPETGLLIPAYTGRRVIYGHPFETVGAEQRKQEVEIIYAQPWNTGTNAYLSGENVDYLWVGPRERELGSISVPSEYPAVFQSGGVTIYRIRNTEEALP